MAYSKTNTRWGFLKPAHKEKCKSPLDSIKYVTKEDTRADGPWEFGIRPSWNQKGQKLKNMDLINGSLTELVEQEKLPLIQLPKIQQAINTYNILKMKKGAALAVPHD